MHKSVECLELVNRLSYVEVPCCDVDCAASIVVILEAAGAGQHAAPAATTQLPGVCLLSRLHHCLCLYVHDSGDCQCVSWSRQFTCRRG